MSGKTCPDVRKLRTPLICLAAIVLLWQAPAPPAAAAPLEPQIGLQTPLPIRLDMPEPGETCSYCGPPPVDDAAGFVVTSLFENGNYVAVWLSKQDGRVHARCLAPNGRKTGADILIPADTSEGLLPTPVSEANGSFRILWARDGKTYASRFNCQGTLLSGEAVIR